MENWQKIILGVIGLVLIIGIFAYFGVKFNANDIPSLSTTGGYGSFGILGTKMLSETGECRDFDGEEWCCDNPGHVFCDNDDPSVCGTQTYCDNRGSAVSCIPGEDWCCYGAGYVADYNAHSCCKPEYPYVQSGYCYWVPGPDSRNWYTEQSSCKGFEMIGGGVGFWQDGAFRSNKMGTYNTAMNEIKLDNPMRYVYCEGTNFWACKGSSPGIFSYFNNGVIKGKCGAECISSLDCTAGQLVGDKFCSGSNVAQKITIASCDNNKCSTGNTEDKVIEECTGLGCAMFADGARCRQCTDGAIENYECGNNFNKTWPKKQCIDGKWQDIVQIVAFSIESSTPCSCTSGAECKADYDVGRNYCVDKNVVQKVMDYNCTSNTCVSAEVIKTVQTCDYKCTNGKCEVNVLLYVIIGVVIVAAIGVAVYFFYFRRKRK